MIEIEIIRKGDRIISLTSKGHAGYADYGQDIVCAGTSAIIFGLFNAIDMVDNTIPMGINREENKCFLTNTTNNEIINNYLDGAFVQLKSIEIKYPKFIRITERRTQ